MRDLLHKRSTQVIMIILVLVIWVYNTSQIMTIQSETENVSNDIDFSGINTFEFDRVATYDYSYSGEYKDPFLPAMGYKETQAPPTEPIIERLEPERPHIELFGIVEGSAVVKMGGSAIHFMQAGDRLEGIRLNNIYADSATFSFNEETFTLNLE